MVVMTWLGIKFGLEGKVEWWADYLRPHLSEHSVQELRGVSHSDESEFVSFGEARGLAFKREEEDDTDSKLHRFVEECDRLEGFHFLTNTHDGFGGLSADLLVRLVDDYPNRPIFTVGFEPHLSITTMRDWAMTIFNAALTLSAFSEYSSVYVPTAASALTPAHVGVAEGCFRPTELWHSSAVFAAALDTATLAYRMGLGSAGAGGSEPVAMGDLVRSVVLRPRASVAELSLAYPLPLGGFVSSHIGTAGVAKGGDSGGGHQSFSAHEADGLRPLSWIGYGSSAWTSPSSDSRLPERARVSVPYTAYASGRGVSPSLTPKALPLTSAANDPRMRHPLPSSSTISTAAAVPSSTPGTSRSDSTIRSGGTGAGSRGWKDVLEEAVSFGSSMAGEAHRGCGRDGWRAAYSPQGVPIPEAFPSFFSQTPYPPLVEGPRPSLSSVPALSLLSTSSQIGGRVLGLMEGLGKALKGRHAESFLESSEWDEIKERLESLATLYAEDGDED